MLKAVQNFLLYQTVQGCLRTICTLITQEVSNVESLERSLHIDITQGFILHKLIELLGKFLEVPNIRSRYNCYLNNFTFEVEILFYMILLKEVVFVFQIHAR